MEDPWNCWDVKPPPICRTKQSLNAKEINKMKRILSQAMEMLKSLTLLNKEAAYLSRILYKSTRPFRHDKGMQILVKIYQCLKRYLKLDLSEVLETFKQSLPSKLPSGATHAYLPTKQMLKWVLLRLQAFSKIFARITDLAKDASAYVCGKLCLGWTFKTNIFMFGILSRLHTLSKYLVIKSIDWYNALSKFLPMFESTADFLPEYSLPIDLKDWLGDVDISPPKRKHAAIDEIFQMIDLSKDKDDEDMAENVIQESLLKSLFKAKGKKNEKVLEIDSDGRNESPAPVAAEEIHPLNHSQDLGILVSAKKRKISKHKAQFPEKKKFRASFNSNRFQ